MPKSIKNQKVLKGLEQLEEVSLCNDAGYEVESYLGKDEIQEYLSQF